MRILALETSTEAGSCALWCDGELLQRDCPRDRSHSETLLPLVRELLAEAGAGIVQLDAIAFGVGPGAFTGLRVACGAAQGLAVAADLPVVPVGSLEVMAQATGAPQVLALLDARMGEIYAGAYLCGDAGPVLQGDIAVCPPEHWAWPASSAGWLATGNALAAYPAFAGQLVAAGIACFPGDNLPTAAGVARLAALRFPAGGGCDPALAAPLYVRDKVAKTVAERLQEGGRA